MTAELYATNRFPGDGTTTQYEINFSGGYMGKSHVKAYTEDPDTLAREDFVITSSMFVGPYTINVGATTPVGKTFVIYRDTPKGEPLVDFVNGSRITEQNLDKVARQAILGLAEVHDASNAAVVAEFTAAAQNVVDAKDDAIAAGAGAQAAQTAAEAAQAAAVAAKDDAQGIADSINPSQFALATDLATLASDTTNALAGKLSNADGSVTLSKLVDGVLEATSAGLAKMADGFLAATTAGRAKMADLFVTTAKLADGAVTGTKMANSGVTAGSYTTANITVDAKGRVTVASSGSGGVTSLNGQTGAIVDTTLYAIGSYIQGRPANYTDYAINSVLAGTSLYSSGPTAYVSGTWSWPVGSTIGTGTWRCMSRAPGSAPVEQGQPGLWVRIS